MAAQRFEVVLPEEVVAGFGWTAGEVSARIRDALVMELVRQQVISQGTAVATRARHVSSRRFPLYGHV